MRLEAVCESEFDPMKVEDWERVSPEEVASHFGCQIEGKEEEVEQVFRNFINEIIQTAKVTSFLGPLFESTLKKMDLRWDVIFL